MLGSNEWGVYFLGGTLFLEIFFDAVFFRLLRLSLFFASRRRISTLSSSSNETAR